MIGLGIFGGSDDRAYDINHHWIDHTPNTRFAIYDTGTSGGNLDNLVLDKETGLISPRDAGLAGQEYWQDPINYFLNLTLGNRKGW